MESSKRTVFITQGYNVLRQLNEQSLRLRLIEERRRLSSIELVAKHCPFHIGDPIEHINTGIVLAIYCTTSIT
jgi:hypothetical protein